MKYLHMKPKMLTKLLLQVKGNDYEENITIEPHQEEPSIPIADAAIQLLKDIYGKIPTHTITYIEE